MRSCIRGCSGQVVVVVVAQGAARQRVPTPTTRLQLSLTSWGANPLQPDPGLICYIRLICRPSIIISTSCHHLYHLYRLPLISFKLSPRDVGKWRIRLSRIYTYIYNTIVCVCICIYATRRDRQQSLKKKKERNMR